VVAVQGFHTSHAVVIGINAYRNGIPQLRTAVNDARRIGQVLQAEFGYSVRLLTEQVTGAKLQALFGEVLPRVVGADDRLLVYFAGHGIALDGDDGPAGYVVPEDARGDDRRSFLAMTELGRWLDRLPCRHLLLVLDCCFAGAFRWTSTRELGVVPDVIHKERFERYVRDAAWQAITSAAHDQKALDVLAGEPIGLRAPEAALKEHSPFAAAFLRGLQGEADLYPRAAAGRPGGDGVITATELYVYLRESVEAGTEGDGRRQTPGLWPLRRHDKGEYIHLVPGRRLDLPPAPELNEQNNPYRGLQSYDEPHASLLFGRAQFIDVLCERVARGALTVVLGASGTGKSSVVKAGLLPRLRGMGPGSWQILPPLRPGKSPLASLGGLAIPGESDHSHDARLGDYWTDPDALAARVGAWADGEGAGKLLLVVDQLEELITLCWDAGERDQFLRLLEQALAAHPERFRVVLTLRSDFEPQFAQTSLEERWMPSQIVIPPLTLDEYRDVIEGPASVRVLYFKGTTSSQEFINRMIGDVANTPGPLPLLSFTLSELYRSYLERRGDDRSLREDDYERLGGVGGSLRNRANQVYESLPDDSSRETMRRVMLRMVSAEAGEIARRRVPDAELVYRDADENRRVADVLRRLTEARLVVEGQETDGQPYVEPAHDELVRGWSRLLEWARRDQEGLLLRRILTPAAADWARGSGGLWHANPRLSLLRKVLESSQSWLNQTEADFVHASVRRRRKLWARGITAVAVAFAALSVITGIALYMRSAARQSEAFAKEETKKALRRERIANARRLAALSRQAFPEEPEQCLLLAVEAIRATRESGEPAEPAAVQALQDGLSTIGGYPLAARDNTINTLAFRPDGRLVTGSRDGTVRVWDYSNPATPPLVLQGHKASISHIAFAPDGRLVTVSSDKTARVWDLKEPTSNPRVLQGHESFIIDLALSRDGRLATCSSDRTVRVWDLRNAEGLPLVLRVEGVAMKLAFVPDARLVTGSYDGIIQVWDLEHPEDSPVVLRGPGRPITVVAVAPDGRLVTATEDWTLQVWDLNNSGTSPLALSGVESSVHHLAFDQNGRMAAVSGNSSLMVWDLKSPASFPLVFRGQAGDFDSLLFAPGGRVAAGSSDKTIRLWKLEFPGVAPTILRGHENIVSRLALAPDGRLVSASWDGTARVWDLDNPTTQPRVLRGKGGDYRFLAIAPGYRLVTSGSTTNSVGLWDLRNLSAGPLDLAGGDAEIVAALVMTPAGVLATGGWKGEVRMWDLGSASREPLVLRGHQRQVYALGFMPGGRLVTASWDGTIRVWDPANPKNPPVVLPGPTDSVAFLAVGPNGRLVTATMSNQTAWVLNPEEAGSAPLPLRGHSEGIEAMAFGPDGRLVTGSTDCTVRVWNLQNQAAAPLVLRGHEKRVSHVQFAPDGRLVTGSWDATARVWDLSRPALAPVVLRGHKEGISAMAFGPDGHLATGSMDRTARLWDLRDPASEPLVLVGHAFPVWAIVFTPDGRLVTGGDGAARVWEIDLDRLIQMAGQVVSRNLAPDEWQQFFGADQPYRRVFPELADGVRPATYPGLEKIRLGMPASE
jgi:WD40 repeat protein